MQSIYLDHNATTPLAPEVAAAMQACQATGFANPGSQHHVGRRARQMLEDARESIASLLGAEVSSTRADRLIFTSGGTESNNLAVLGLAGQEPGRLVISAIEHPSVVGPAEELQRRGWQLERLRVDSRGVVELDHLRSLLTEPTSLVSVMQGNNETGVLQPLEEIAEICRKAGVPLHTDAVQVVGKLPLDFTQLGATALSLTAHKFHGPPGIGALLLRPEAQLRPQLFGGFQQQALRPGTETVALAVGMNQALQLWHAERDQRPQRMSQLRDQFEQTLLEACPSVVVNSRDAPRLPHTSSVAFVGVERESMLMALDLAAVACSTGSACASGSSDPSPTLVAMGLPQHVYESSLRFSLGAWTSEAEVVAAARRIIQIYKDLGNHSGG